MRPVWEHLHLLHDLGLPVLVHLQHGGVEGGADGGHVQTDWTDGGVGVDEGRDGGVVGEMVEHHQAEVGVGVEGCGGGEVTGGRHLDLRSLSGVQQARQLRAGRCGQQGPGWRTDNLYPLDGRAVTGSGELPPPLLAGAVERGGE